MNITYEQIVLGSAVATRFILLEYVDMKMFEFLWFFFGDMGRFLDLEPVHCMISTTNWRS